MEYPQIKTYGNYIIGKIGFGLMSEQENYIEKYTK